MTAPIFSTLGCRLNAYETEAMKELAAAAGLSGAVIVNTCAVTAEAVRKAKQEIRRLARENPGQPVIVTGCAAQTEPETFAAMPEVTRVIGNHEKMQAQTWAGLSVPDLIGVTEKVQVNDILSIRETAGHLIDGFGRVRAYVQVQNGCDHRCTFCIIPYGRGNSRSVPAGVVVEQIKRLVDKGFLEVVLTGVDLTITGFAFAPACQVGGNVEITGKYQATLPDNPRAGQVVHVTLHQQVDPGGVDRFTITLKAPEAHDGEPAAMASFVYLASLTVTQDAAGDPADGGSVLLDAGLPLVDNISYFAAARDATATDVGTGGLCGGEAECVRTQLACWNDNRKALLPLLSVPAARSENGNLAATSLLG